MSDNGIAPIEQTQLQEFSIPPFVVNLIGRLQLENAALRSQVELLQSQLSAEPTK